MRRQKGPNPKPLLGPYIRALHTEENNGARTLPSAPRQTQEVDRNTAQVGR